MNKRITITKTRTKGGDCNLNVNCTCGLPITVTNEYGMFCKNLCGIQEAKKDSGYVSQLILKLTGSKFDAAKHVRDILNGKGQKCVKTHCGCGRPITIRNELGDFCEKEHGLKEAEKASRKVLLDTSH